tara:strand:+ start:50 stop:628 length:579 start_codon:yes stop_codon:yes gene_type:complete
MNKVLVLLLISPLVFAEMKTTQFNLNCKVTGQVLIESVEGVAKKYTHFTDSLLVGDIFSIKFEFVEYTNSKAYRLTIKASELDINAYIASNYVEKIYGEGLKTDFTGTTYIKEDSFIASNPFSELSARRYYKNDWHIMSDNKAQVGETMKTLTANCMNMPMEWDKSISTIKVNDKEKWYGTPSFTSDDDYED